MNTNEYVSLELAKALKEAGFDWKCNAYFFFYDEEVDGEEVIFQDESYKCNYNSKVWVHTHYSAPTLAQAHKWLREVKGIAINVIAHDFFEDKRRAGKYHWKEVYLPCCNESGQQWAEWSIYGYYPLFITNEEALSGGLSKMLKLINYKQEQQ